MNISDTFFTSLIEAAKVQRMWKFKLAELAQGKWWAFDDKPQGSSSNRKFFVHIHNYYLLKREHEPIVNSLKIFIIIKTDGEDYSQSICSFSGIPTKIMDDNGLPLN
jgi:hypothetical protein